MHVKNFFEEVCEIAKNIDFQKVESLISELVDLRERKGRLFVLGVGGSAGNSSHAVNDFRKLCGIEAYAPTDNVSELTARTNDEGWETVFSGWLEISRLNKNDALLIFSVGGGDQERRVSVNLIRAIEMAKKHKAKVFGIVGRPNGYAAQESDCSIVIPSPNKSLVTPHSEAFQAVIWHCVVSSPRLQLCETKW